MEYGLDDPGEFLGVDIDPALGLDREAHDATRGASRTGWDLEDSEASGPCLLYTSRCV